MSTPSLRTIFAAPRRGSRRAAGAAALAAVLLLAGCAGALTPIETQDAFEADSTYSRTFAAVDADTCEAARRALLSQGYIVNSATAQQVRGKKSFQPAGDVHADIEFTVVCAREGYKGVRTIAFVNAVQDNYRVRKSNNSASLGVSPFGSVSLPFAGSDEALVKVGSATIRNPTFYERFFQLIENYLAGDTGQRMPDASASAPAAAASAAR
ncbi:DUF2242 domain-containing protein [Piscinibacter koreensis]|uniref:DUF2242 domain-containing protein n=1 Tax=Piscinibacter koreensis TaxID=2742824 RepID=A0A7Y6NNI1_9BURK|nr:DUF2242 domain-containing protein [Schlegelella koreensis]NUZ06445.1 DUF2242 domain-containing protein [Schlegelella koreensis]